MATLTPTADLQPTVLSYFFFQCDLDSQRQVSKEEGGSLAKKLNMLFTETSAKTMEGIEVIFQDMVEQIVCSSDHKSKQDDDKTIKLDQGSSDNVAASTCRVCK